MRLLHSQTLEFKEFFNLETTPPYAILSHTWGSDEVTFKEMRKYQKAERQRGASRLPEGNDHESSVSPEIEARDGFRKIRFCARQAVKDRLDYFWVDTCCIDKTSSAELSEAINSMFRWYKDSNACYAYLSDIHDAVFFNAERPGSVNYYVDAMTSSLWFSRGWTLQELIAPRKVLFYTAEGSEIGAKTTLSICVAISQRTQIPIFVIRAGNFSTSSVAERMSWAASRRTTRVEDRAYSLLGLFGIHMPLLYGEGEHAFVRLQQEIAKHSDDLSIFAWKDPEADEYLHTGLLARSPSEFKHSRTLGWDRVVMNRNLQVTDKEIKLDVVLQALGGSSQDYIALLPGVNSKFGLGRVGIYLRKTPEGDFTRVNVKGVVHYDNDRVLAGPGYDENDNPVGDFRTVSVRHIPILSKSSFSRVREITVTNAYNQVDLMRIEARPEGCWDEESSTFYFEKLDGSGKKPTAAFISLLFPHIPVMIFPVDLEKDLEARTILNESWCLSHKKDKYDGFTCVYKNVLSRHTARVELTLVLRGDICVLDVTIAMAV